jgi:flagellin-like protein
MTAGCLRFDRGQSAVVGVAILLGLTVVGVGVLTAAAGTAIQEGASTAATARVADGLDDALDAGTAAGTDATVRLAGGTVRVADRRVRVLNDSGVVWAAPVGAVVYESGDRRVSAVAGAVAVGEGDRTRLDSPPSIAPANGTLYVGVPVLNASGTDAVSARGTTVPVRFETAPTHERRLLPSDRYRVAVETTAPDAWERAFQDRNATTTRRDFDDDGTPSVVAAFPGRRTLHLVVHDVRLQMEVGA